MSTVSLQRDYCSALVNSCQIAEQRHDARIKIFRQLNDFELVIVVQHSFKTIKKEQKNFLVMPRCKAFTNSGSPCRNLGKREFGGYCGTHAKLQDLGLKPDPRIALALIVGGYFGELCPNPFTLEDSSRVNAALIRRSRVAVKFEKENCVLLLLRPDLGPNVHAHILTQDLRSKAYVTFIHLFIQTLGGTFEFQPRADVGVTQQFGSIKARCDWLVTTSTIFLNSQQVFTPETLAWDIERVAHVVATDMGSVSSQAKELLDTLK